MTQSENYVEGKWYGWNGGECPVHPDTDVDVVCHDLLEDEHESVRACAKERAGDWCWSDESEPIIAFRVVKYHVEPKVVWVNEYANNCWSVYETKEKAKKLVGKYATRVAVCYVEKTNDTE